MNKKSESAIDNYTMFRMLSELARGDVISQRDLARRLDGALGLVNSYLKFSAEKGWVRVRQMSPNRSSYQLTPKGFAEQRNLALFHARYIGIIMDMLREEYLPLCRKLNEDGVEKVAICGIDEIAGIVRAILSEFGIDVTLAMDSEGLGRDFAGLEVVSVAHAMLIGFHRVVISSLTKSRELHSALLELGLDQSAIMAPGILMGKRK